MDDTTRFELLSELTERGFDERDPEVVRRLANAVGISPVADVTGLSLDEILDIVGG